MAARSTSATAEQSATTTANARGIPLSAKKTVAPLDKIRALATMMTGSQRTFLI
jgi:hypothetical protein